MKRLTTEGLLTARLLNLEHASLELQRSSACSLELPYRRWHVVSFYLGAPVRVSRRGPWGNATGDFRHGTVGFYPAGESESVVWHGPTLALHLHLEPRFLDARWQELGGRGSVRPKRVVSMRHPRLARLGGGLFDCLRHRGARHRAEAERLVSEVADCLAGGVLAAGRRKDPPRVGLLDLDELLDRMHGPPAIETNGAELAAATGLGERRFRQLFRTHFGTSPHDQLLRSRIELAKARIQEGDRLLTDLAHELGFFDQAHFTRTFKRRIGRTPSRYAEWLDQLD